LIHPSPSSAEIFRKSGRDIPKLFCAVNRPGSGFRTYFWPVRGKGQGERKRGKEQRTERCPL
jgi:hypothetical protein